MNDNVGLFWAALGTLTFAETVKVAETMRDTCETVGDLDQSNVTEWAFLLNTAREFYESSEEVRA